MKHKYLDYFLISHAYFENKNNIFELTSLLKLLFHLNDCLLIILYFGVHPHLFYLFLIFLRNRYSDLNSRTLTFQLTLFKEIMIFALILSKKYENY